MGASTGSKKSCPNISSVYWKYRSLKSKHFISTFFPLLNYFCRPHEEQACIKVDQRMIPQLESLGQKKKKCKDEYNDFSILSGFRSNKLKTTNKGPQRLGDNDRSIFLLVILKQTYNHSWYCTGCCI